MTSFVTKIYNVDDDYNISFRSLTLLMAGIASDVQPIVPNAYHRAHSCDPSSSRHTDHATPSVPLKLIHTATPDTTKLSCLCRARFGGVNWIPDNSRLSPTENLKFEHVNSNCPIHTATPDKITAPASRRPQRRRPGRQLRRAMQNVNTRWIAAYDET